MLLENLSFIHHYSPAQNATATDTLLLLHGTGGDENDLLPLGRLLLPAANLLSPRGQVSENGMARFFRRLAEGVFDVPDLIARTHELAEFVASASEAYGFDPKRVIAAGFSNGANIAAALLLLRPGVLQAAALFHPMVPLVPESLPDLDSAPVFLGAGRHDPIVSPQETEKLASLLRQAGANAIVHWQAGGHSLSRDEVQAAAEWLATRSGS